MIKIKINRDNSQNITSFSVKGHAYAAEPGRDIVCASVSILTQTAALALYEVADIDIIYEMDDGWLYCQIPEKLEEGTRQKANVILDTMLVGIKGTMEMYPDYIKLLDKEV
jgi:hypothetical protein